MNFSPHQQDRECTLSDELFRVMMCQYSLALSRIPHRNSKTYLTYLNPPTPPHNWGGDGGSGYWASGSFRQITSLLN